MTDSMYPISMFCAAALLLWFRAPAEAAGFELTSPAFAPGGRIPPAHSKQGANASPPLRWSGAPEGTCSFTLICDDPDAPGGLWTHWLVWNMPAGTTEIPERLGGREPELPGGIRQGTTSWGRVGYDGPQPPSGTHRYVFRLYALDRVLDLPGGAGRSGLEAAVKGHVLAAAELTGRYSR
jgi:Raf kinase inhibitor-like YbhB/YbcL family protein